MEKVIKTVLLWALNTLMTLIMQLMENVMFNTHYGINIKHTEV